MSERAPIVVAITGASGAPYAVRLLESLVRAKERVWLMISSHGWRLLQMESGVGSIEELRARTDPDGWDAYVTLFDSEDRGAAPASGSARTRGMVICPCSMGTLAAIAAGTSRSLVERAGDVTLKERRPLVLVARETPLSVIHLENMLRITRAGAVVLPAAPGFYNSPRGIPDLVDFVVARVLDHLDVEHSLGKRWGAEPHDEG
ncbi:MAG TPA: flavin prenyltransferase UbiX [Gemmatimonadaceae bacterium]|jgi:4-hydroxy-3-polyprenylbenzoate decarboxylase|nr:flavin prenyltransferase UbiX [Gemmatimonadaceae bacterium]